MRLILIAAAACAAFAVAAPASAQTQEKELRMQKLCPDLTLNQIEVMLPELVVKHKLSSDPAEATVQAAVLLCDYVEADPSQSELDAKEAVINIPPPHFGQRRPPRMRIPPPRPRHAMPQHRPMPHRAAPRSAPPPRVAGMQQPYREGGRGGYGAGGGQRLMHSQTSQTCRTQETALAPPTHSRKGIPYTSCNWEDKIPRDPSGCGGWHCTTRK